MKLNFNNMDKKELIKKEQEAKTQLIDKLLKVSNTLDIIFSKTENINEGLIHKMDKDIMNYKQLRDNLQNRVDFYKREFAQAKTGEECIFIAQNFVQEFKV